MNLPVSVTFCCTVAFNHSHGIWHNALDEGVAQYKQIVSTLSGVSEKKSYLIVSFRGGGRVDAIRSYLIWGAGGSGKSQSQRTQKQAHWSTMSVLIIKSFSLCSKLPVPNPYTIIPYKCSFGCYLNAVRAPASTTFSGLAFQIVIAL